MNFILQTPTPNLKESIQFYENLNFSKVPSEKLNLYTDGKVLMNINPDRYARAGICLYRKNWQNEKLQLEESVHLNSMEQGYLLADSSGTWFYLIEGLGPEEDLSAYKPSVLGNYAGVSLESPDINKSFKILEILGFYKTMGEIEQGWVVLSDANGQSISLMKPFSCPHLFFNPSMTYFNSGKNPEVIEKVRELNVPITEEITHFSKDGTVDNIIIRDPGGFGFFVFND